MNKSSVLLILILFTLSCDNSPENIGKIKHEDTVASEQKLVYDYEKNENRDSLEYDYYVKLINPDSIGCVQHTIDSDLNESFENYLGPIYCADRDVTYDVTTKFDLIQVADGQRGNSKIIFLGKGKKTCRIYYLDMPDQLPIFIQNNELIFYIEGDTLKENLNEGLLPLFCTPLNSCFE